jgi:hypothetical protein
MYIVEERKKKDIRKTDIKKKEIRKTDINAECQYPSTNQKPGKRTNQNRGDFFYVRVPTIYLLRKSSLVFWIFLTDQYHAT